jgi:thioredoxin 1
VVALDTSAALTDIVKDAGDSLVVVDFHAQWCGPCKQIAPAFEKLSDLHTEVKFTSVDVDEVQDLAQAAQVTGVPAFHFIKNGALVANVTGADLDQITKLVEEHK